MIAVVFEEWFVLEIFIDADGCPVVDITVKISAENGIKSTIICDTAHIFEYENIETIVVSKGADSVDFVLINKVKKGDIVITQDYGLAAMCIAKNVIPINQNGFIYTNENIDNMLLKRHIAKQIRRAGGKIQNMKKRKISDNDNFKKCLTDVIRKYKRSTDI